MVRTDGGPVRSRRGGAELEGADGGRGEGLIGSGWRGCRSGGHHDGRVERGLERDPAVAVLVIHLPRLREVWPKDVTAGSGEVVRRLGR